MNGEYLLIWKETTKDYLKIHFWYLPEENEYKM